MARFVRSPNAAKSVVIGAMADMPSILPRGMTLFGPQLSRFAALQTDLKTHSAHR